MRPEERQALRERFNLRCGYCDVSEEDVGSELTVDHFQPRARDGPDEAENCVYACNACNTYKSDTWAPGSDHRILHPLNDRRSEHVAEGPDGVLVGLTETGRFHIGQLQLNRPALVAHRLARRREAALEQVLVASLRQQEEMRQRVESLEQAAAEAERRLSSL